MSLSQKEEEEEEDFRTRRRKRTFWNSAHAFWVRAKQVAVAATLATLREASTTSSAGELAPRALVIVTGTAESRETDAKLKPAITTLLHDHGIKPTEPKLNSGMIVVDASQLRAFATRLQRVDAALDAELALGAELPVTTATNAPGAP